MTTVHISVNVTLGAGVYVQMFWSSGQSDLKPPALSSQSSLVLIYRPTEAARGLLTTDHVILNHGQVTWMTPELAPFSPNYHTTPTGKRFNSQQV
ncbi:hypothetical protein TNCV_2506521 [Trichonephila clavipes]|uniref:Uncharacterized protein n=1 Tax=Trichonephila clavipes TaxID=2585209 RepID=A0A8X6WHC6_TRICX|nr:hypothetical protein TNCV_2506521 [Trichonephila clavipes]